MDSIRVLLIEDSPTHVELVRGFLDGNGTGTFTMSVAETFEAGVNAVGSDLDVVLLDLTLPDSDGLDTFTGLAQAHPELPIVIFTGTDDEELALTALHHGAADYLVKSEVNAAWLRRSLVYATHRDRPPDVSAEEVERTASIQRAMEVEPSDNGVTVRMNEKRLVNVVIIEAMQERLVRTLNRAEGKQVRLDFSSVEYCSNAAISMFLLLHKRAKVVGAELLFCHVSPTVREYFASRRFDKVFRFEGEGK